MLGYTDGFVMSVRWPGSSTIWLDQVTCRGSETDIADCPHSSWGSHSDDVSVQCMGTMETTTTTTTTARPRPGKNEYVKEIGPSDQLEPHRSRDFLSLVLLFG